MKEEIKLKFWQRILLLPFLYLGILTFFIVAVTLVGVGLVVGLPAAILFGKFYLKRGK